MFHKKKNDLIPLINVGNMQMLFRFRDTKMNSVVLLFIMAFTISLLTYLLQLSMMCQFLIFTSQNGLSYNF